METIPYPEECRTISLEPNVQRWTPFHEVQALCWLAGQMVGDILEIGCNEGRTTRDLALNYPSKTIVGVDYCGEDDTLCPSQKGEKPSRENLGMHARELGNVQLKHIKSGEIDFSSSDFAGVRFIFIDGDHSYSGVKIDTKAALDHLEKVGGGTIVWHDCYEDAPDWVGVQKYLETEVAPFYQVKKISGTWLAVLKVHKPIHDIPREWDDSLVGDEMIVCKSIADLQDPSGFFYYAQIGMSGGKTFSSICEFLATMCDSKWTATVLGTHKDQASDIRKIVRNLKQFYKNMRFANLISDDGFPDENPSPSYDFVLVDGCKGKSCIKSHFMMVATRMRLGGVICFLDVAERMQGKHFQTHCQSEIAVRMALEELGLFADEMTGWRFLGENNDDNPNSRGLAFFRYVGSGFAHVAEPIKAQRWGISRNWGHAWLEQLAELPVRRKYSQHGEDGIIEFIFKEIGTTNRYYVDLGAGDGIRESNTRSLMEQGWRGLLLDKNSQGSSEIRKEHICVDNINLLLKRYEVPEEFDFLSLDIDGNEYWIWQAMNWRPRVVCIEFNESFPRGVSKVIKYAPDFVWEGDDFHGASFTAVEKLGDLKGYTLISVCGGNMIFVRKDVLGTHFKPQISFSVKKHFHHREAGDWEDLDSTKLVP